MTETEKLAILGRRTPNAEPLLSVIMISYNEAEYLPQAIDSCLSQSFTDIEIIIGDDGSNDNSLEVIEAYCKKYPDKIRYFVMDRPSDDRDIIPSLRVSNLIKTGLKQARGTYISCLSGDDCFCNDEKFSDAVTFLNAHKAYSAYVSGFKMFFPDGREHISRAPYPRSLFWSGIYIHVSSFVFRKSVFDDGYFLNRSCDDTGLIFSTACAGKWKFTDKITFAYRQREGSIMHKANALELAVLELFLFQDCLCSGKMRWSSYSRFYRPMRFTYANRKDLTDASYTKYFISCEPYPHNILKAIAESDSSLKSKIYVLSMLLRGKTANRFFRYAIKFYNLPGRIARRIRKIFFRMLE